MQAALEIRDLWVALDRGDVEVDVLRGIDLRAEPGERLALMGRNGAGKSTLLRTAAGLIAPARGRIDTPRGCALLTQSPGDFLVRERVGDELKSPAGRAALDAVGLAGKEESDPRDLSGGERQRLALAIVLAGRDPDGSDAPGLVCLDEPTRGMDRARKDDLAALAHGLAARGTAVMIATHDVEFAATCAERVILLGRGEVVADGPVTELLAGGWYFSTEVARALDGRAVTAERGVEVALAARRRSAEAPTAEEGTR